MRWWPPPRAKHSAQNGAVEKNALAASPSSGYAPLAITFTATLNNKQMCDPSRMLVLAFGDGESASLPLSAGCGSSGADIRKILHTYKLPGTYSASVSDATMGGTPISLATKSVRATVNPNKSAPTCTVSADKKQVARFEPFTISWSSTGAVYMTGLPAQSKWPTNGTFTTRAETTGTYQKTLTFYGAGGQKKCMVKVIVTNNVVSDTTPPTVSLTAPAADSTVFATTTITASASDDVGVAAVEFKNDTTTLNTDTSSPYSYSWDTTGAQNGPPTLHAVARDAAGNRATSTVSVDVQNAKDEKACKLKAPKTVQAKGDLSLSWTVANAYTAGVVALGNAALVGTPSLPSGSKTLTAPALPGIYSYFMVVNDNAGHYEMCSEAVDVTDDTPRDVFSDLSAASLAPSSQEKILFFKGTESLVEEGDPDIHTCMLRYRKESGRVQASWTIIPPTPLSDALKIPAHVFSNLAGSSRICTETPPAITTTENSVTVASRGITGDIANEATFGPNGVTLHARPTELAANYFGIPYFTSKDARSETKLNQYFNSKYASRNLSDYSSLTLMFSATPRKVDYVYPPPKPDDPPFVDGALSGDEKICVKGMPLQHAEDGTSCLKAGTSVGHFRMVTNVFWTDPRCKKNDPSDPVCRYHNRHMYITIHVSGPKSGFPTDDAKFKPIFFDAGRSADYIYRMDLKKFFPSGTVLNPFQDEGVITSVSRDILPDVREGILYAVGQNPPECADGSYWDPERCVLPPKLAGESDEDYINHFIIQGADIGYEIVAPSDLSNEIHTYSLVGIKKTGVQANSAAAHGSTTSFFSWRGLWESLVAGVGTVFVW